MHLLDNYTIDARTRYENHTLFYTTADSVSIELRGMLAAAVVAALLVDTPEGDARGIAIDTDEQRADFFARYEREVRRENGGLFTTEVQALNEAYMEIDGESKRLYAICGNDRLYDLAFGLMMDYMHRLVREQVGEQIYTVVPWRMPFAQWLFDAGMVETRRQQLLSIDWSDPEAVYTVAQQFEKPDETETIEPTFVFEGLRAEQVLRGYWEWLWEAAQQEANLYPDGKVQLAQMKQLIRENETDYDFLKPEMNHFTPAQLNLFRKWMTQWKEFVETKLKPEKQISFWTKTVTEEQQEQLLDYLKIQERQPQRYKCLAVAVYSLRQMGYVSRDVSVPSMAKWLSERLMNDYSSKTGLYQFRRAWNELRRYHPAVVDEVSRLAELGVGKIV